MCITSSSSTMSKTSIYVGEGKYQDQDVHVMAYQNTAENLSGGPNAMVLPFPTKTPMSQDNMIDTRKFSHFLKDITKASQMVFRSMTLGGGSRRNVTKGGFDSLAAVFDVGSYTVILADNVGQIPEAVGRVPENKRPNFTAEFLEGMGKLYPEQPIAVCCFDGKIEAEPLLWWYVPTDSSTFFAPTMDAHDGRAPVVNAMVDVDHVISTGSYDDSRIGHHNKVYYTETIPEEVRSLLPNYAFGKKWQDVYNNGDTFIKIGATTEGAKYTDMPLAVRGPSPEVVADLTQIKYKKFYLSGWS